MCGIVGIALADPRGRVDRELLERMTSLLAHRGPDSRGFHLAAGAGLGLQRLSIVDLETGDQPIRDESGTIAVVCNGEIYNHVELRHALEAAGHRFRTRSDVEVIVHLYEDEGLEAIHRLRGMFAFALWDERRRRLWLARDRLGIKPLHYALTADGLYFASELKAILAADEVARDVDIAALDQVFRFGFVLEPQTPFARIRRLAPGCWLVYEDGQATVRPYWRLPAQAMGSPLSTVEWAERLRAKLDETVRLHLMSDVEVGAWLSTGVDSSGVVSLAARLGQRPLPTFTLAFEDSEFDETRRRRTLDRFPGHAVPNERCVCNRATFALYPRALWHAESPSATGLEAARFPLAELTARRVKVVLTGEGADEVFGGYPWFLADHWLRPLRHLPRIVRRALLLGPLLPARWPWGSRVALGAGDAGLTRYAQLMGPIGAERRQSLYSADLTRALAETAAAAWTPPADLARWPSFAQIRYLEFSQRLPSLIVLTLDRQSMAHGVEARVPFLDHELIELCAQIPPTHMLRGLREKYVLRRALEHDLPPEVVWRRKWGLRAPCATWLRDPLPEFAEDLLSPPRLRAKGYFRPEAVQQGLAVHRRGGRQEAGLLIGVLAVQLWDELFRRPASALAAPGAVTAPDGRT
jgi:asparagine synthase (glutamine-hydrolysing)